MWPWVLVQVQNATVIILGKKNRTVPSAHDAKICKEQNYLERTISGLKRVRAVAARFDKRATNYCTTYCLIAALTGL